MSCFIEVTTDDEGAKVFINVPQIICFVDGKIICNTKLQYLTVIETREEIAEKIRRSTHPDAVDHCFEDILRYD